MTLAQARFIGYLIGATTGAVLAVIGAVQSDPALVAAGLGLVGTGGLAAGNTPVRSVDADAA